MTTSLSEGLRILDVSASIELTRCWCALSRFFGMVASNATLVGLVLASTQLG